jgi:hypothetical protein
MPRKQFMDGDALSAGDINTNLMNQTVQTYSLPADRTLALPFPLEGQVTTLNTTKNLETYYGQWRPLPFAMEVGNVSITPTPNAASGVAVTFAAGRFTQEPRIFTTADSAASAVVNTQYSAASTSGATIRVHRTNSTTTFVMYLAIQMTNGTANG